MTGPETLIDTLWAYIFGQLTWSDKTKTFRIQRVLSDVHFEEGIFETNTRKLENIHFPKTKTLKTF